MKIKIIIEDVDVSVAQLLGLLQEQENVTVEVEQPPTVAPVPVEVLPAKEEKKEELLSHITRDPKAKGGKRYTCQHCGSSFSYEKSYQKCVDRCLAKKQTTDENKEKPAKIKFERKITLPKKKVKKTKPTYKVITDTEVEDMVLSALTGNPNTIVTSAQIAGNYISTVHKKYSAKDPGVISMSKTIEHEVVTVMERAAKALGPSQCMSMPIVPDGLQIALFAKSGLTLKSLKKKLK